MSVYMIGFVDIKDEQRFKDEYGPPTGESMARYGAKLLARDQQPDVKEGHLPIGHTVICEFPDRESAENWYNSEEYAPLIKIREEIADTTLAFISGVEQQN